MSNEGVRDVVGKIVLRVKIVHLMSAGFVMQGRMLTQVQLGVQSIRYCGNTKLEICMYTRIVVVHLLTPTLSTLH